MAVSGIIILLLVASSKAKEAKNERLPHRVTPCGCRYKDVLYDLSKLARSNGSARFTIPSAEKDSFYSYNPCIPFSITSSVSKYHCINVAICYWSKDYQRRDPLGYQYPSQIHCELSDEKNVALVYKQGGQGKLLNYTTTIEMICDRTKTYPEEAIMTLKQGKSTALPVFQIFHQCCCPEGCASCPDVNPGTLDDIQYMTYYEIGTAVGGAVFIVVAGFIGYMIARKKYRGNDRLLRLPPDRNNGYGAAHRQERRGDQGWRDNDGAGGREGDGFAIEAHRDHGSHTDSDDSFAEPSPNLSIAGDNDNRSRSIATENDEETFYDAEVVSS